MMGMGLISFNARACVQVGDAAATLQMLTCLCLRTWFYLAAKLKAAGETHPYTGLDHGRQPRVSTRETVCDAGQPQKPFVMQDHHRNCLQRQAVE
jgi:hypothetical protein